MGEFADGDPGGVPGAAAGDMLGYRRDGGEGEGRRGWVALPGAERAELGGGVAGVGGGSGATWRPEKTTEMSIRESQQ